MKFEIKYPDPDRIDFADYMNFYDDIANHCNGDMSLAREHWITHGKNEGRSVKINDVDLEMTKDYIIKNHIPDTYDGPKLKVVTSMYFEKNEGRRREYRFALEINCLNPMIEKIIIYYEQEGDEKFEDVYINHQKIEIIYCDGRPSFGEIFEKTNKTESLWIISNADIILTKDFDKFEDVNFINKIFTLTRWEFISESDITIFSYEQSPNLYSQDTWIYKTPIKFPNKLYDVQLGKILCDSNVCHLFSSRGIPVLNPCKDVKTLHIHFENSRTQKYENLENSEERKFDATFPYDWPRTVYCNLEDLIS